MVTSLTIVAFIATLRRFIVRQGRLSMIWSDHGTNFIASARELEQLMKTSRNEASHFQYCSNQGIQWKFIPEQSSHFGALWEAAVKSFKTHLKQIVGDMKVNFEELTTITTQIEGCLNSRLLTLLPENTDETEALTPGHFIIRHPLKVVPDSGSSHQLMPELKRWHLCQTLVRHFWQRWSSEYLGQLQKFSK